MTTLTIGCMLAFAAAAGATGAAAQGLLDTLFGSPLSGPAPAAAQSAAPKLRHMPTGRPHPEHFRSSPPYFNRRGLDDFDQRERLAPGEGSGRTGAGGRYRTMCVRLCDGFYFPLSAAAPRSRFDHDRRRCEARCGENGRLYFARAGSSEANELIDASGRPYARLATAFLYRKRLVPGCGCRPEPWSASEQMRHAGYALEEQRQLREVERRIAEAETNAEAAGKTAAAPSATSGDQPAPLATVEPRASRLTKVSVALVFGVSSVTAEPVRVEPATPSRAGEDGVDGKRTAADAPPAQSAAAASGPPAHSIALPSQSADPPMPVRAAARVPATTERPTSAALRSPRAVDRAAVADKRTSSRHMPGVVSRVLSPARSLTPPATVASRGHPSPAPRMVAGQVATTRWPGD